MGRKASKYSDNVLNKGGKEGESIDLPKQCLKGAIAPGDDGNLVCPVHPDRECK